jgi:hypothetical protein
MTTGSGMKETAMRSKVLVLCVGLLALCLGTARAAEQDSLWNRAVATITLARRSVASRIETHTEVYNGSGKLMETHDRVETLTGWNDQEPIRKSEMKDDVVQRSGLRVGIDLGARDNPFFASSEGRTWHERAGEDTLDGHSCIVFRFEEKQPRAVSSKGDAPAQVAAPPSERNADGIGTLVGMAWLERETGTPRRIVYHPKEMPAHVSNYDLTVNFSTLPDGSTVPRALDMEMKAGFLWYKRVVRLHKSFSDWTIAPDTRTEDPSPGTDAADTR